MTLCVVVGVQSVALQRLKDFGVLGQLSSDRIFADVDRAIEQAEDDLLRDQAAAVSAELPLAEVGALMNFSEHEIAVIASRLDRVEKAKGSVIFQEGEPGYNSMITRGRPAPICGLRTVNRYGSHLDPERFSVSLPFSTRIAIRNSGRR
jgi:hypothetical protein